MEGAGILAPLQMVNGREVVRALGELRDGLARDVVEALHGPLALGQHGRKLLRGDLLACGEARFDGGLGDNVLDAATNLRRWRGGGCGCVSVTESVYPTECARLCESVRVSVRGYLCRRQRGV